MIYLTILKETKFTSPENQEEKKKDLLKSVQSSLKSCPFGVNL